MSLCSNTLRAQLRRSRNSRSYTLLPFLYQTATIQQWSQQSRRMSRTYATSRVLSDDSIPFEDADGNLPPPVEHVSAARKTTMTAAERAAFEKLYKTFNSQGEGSKGNKGEHEDLDQIADEYYEDDEDTSGKSSLDKAFEAVLGGPLRSNAQQDQLSSVPTRSDAAKPDVPAPETAHSKRKREAKAERDRVKKLQLEERERVRLLLKRANSDRHLWSILERQVFEPLRKLDLDGSSAAKGTAMKPSRKSRSGTNQSNSTEEQTLFANYPSYMLTALLTLRHNFPSSQYPLRLLPTIKSLGRSSYALGASTVLYKHLIRTAWLQYSSYTLMDTLLNDMDTNATEFDAGILEVLDAVIKEHDMACSGKLGNEIQLVYGFDQRVEGIQKIKQWRKDIASRLGVDDVPLTLKRQPRPHRSVDSHHELPVQEQSAQEGLTQEAPTQASLDTTRPEVQGPRSADHGNTLRVADESINDVSDSLPVDGAVKGTQSRTVNATDIPEEDDLDDDVLRALDEGLSSSGESAASSKQDAEMTKYDAESGTRRGTKKAVLS